MSLTCRAMWNGVRGSAVAASAAADSFEFTGLRMFLLRHGQSYFNLHFNRTRTDPGIEDPELTPAGIAQARTAASALTDTPLTRIIVSPYTRALQTAQPFLLTHDASFAIMHEV